MSLCNYTGLGPRPLQIDNFLIISIANTGKRYDRMAQDPTVAAEQQFQRLPNDVVPKNYKLAITPDLKAFTFTGKLEIAAEVRLCNQAGDL